MIYLFEDSRGDPLSTLFQAAYPKKVSDSFEYSVGNGKLFDKAIEFS